MDVLLDVATPGFFISDGTGFADFIVVAPTGRISRLGLADRAILLMLAPIAPRQGRPENVALAGV